MQDESDCYYVYRQKMGTITQTGLVVCAGVDDYQSGVIKKHELTRADKEEDRVRHIDRLDANDEPVFYTSRSCSEIEGIVEGLPPGCRNMTSPPMTVSPTPSGLSPNRH